MQGTPSMVEIVVGGRRPLCLHLNP